MHFFNFNIIFTYLFITDRPTQHFQLTLSIPKICEGFLQIQGDTVEGEIAFLNH